MVVFLMRCAGGPGVWSPDYTQIPAGGNPFPACRGAAFPFWQTRSRLAAGGKPMILFFYLLALIALLTGTPPSGWR
jgi:hypothetical protein